MTAFVVRPARSIPDGVKVLLVDERLRTVFPVTLGETAFCTNIPVNPIWLLLTIVDGPRMLFEIASPSSPPVETKSVPLA